MNPKHRAPSPAALLEISATVEQGVHSEILDATTRFLKSPSVDVDGVLVGLCVDDRHSRLCGRIRVQIEQGAHSRELWIPKVMGLAVRIGDRVLLLRAGNWDELITIGVLDGFAQRPEVERQTAVALELKPDERVRIDSEDGTGLIEVYRGEEGPVVRLLDRDLKLEFPGELHLSAKAICLEARQGQLQLNASDDVVVKGENIRLN